MTPTGKAIQSAGDKFSNHISVSGDGGNLVIQATDGTTLKLAAKHPSNYTQDSPTQITGLHALDTGLPVTMTMGTGDDQVTVQDFNGVNTNPAAKPNSVKVDLGTGFDSFGLIDSVVKDLAVLAGKGPVGAEADIIDSTVRGATTLSLPATDSNIFLFSGSSFKGAVKVASGNGDDILLADSSTFEKTFSAALAAGDDSVDLSSKTIFMGAVSMDGGKDANDIKDDGTTIYLSKKKISNLSS